MRKRMSSSDPDLVYRNAVTKLRALLSATEAVSNPNFDSPDDLEPYPFFNHTVDGGQDMSFGGARSSFGGSLDHLHQVRSSPSQLHPDFGLTDPSKFRRSNQSQRRYVKHTNSKVKRQLFNNSQTTTSPVTRTDGFHNERERHNSWHNLVQVGVEKPRQEELTLMQKQEVYIAQLEKETHFCREQLSIVLKNVKDVLNEKEAEKRSEEVNKAVSGVFATIQGWQNNIPPNNKELELLQLENVKLKEALKEVGSQSQSGSNALTEKLKKDNEILVEAVKKARSDVDDVRKTEAEAVEQVQRSVQVAEQLRMEKTELEYEIEQLKLQVDRQQTRIRGLIEEQVTKIDEEREIVEKRAQEQAKALRMEINANMEEIGKISSELDRSQRTETELKRTMTEHESIAETVRSDLEKRLNNFQLEIVALNSQKSSLEQELGTLKIDLSHAQHELKAEKGRNDTEITTLRTRLTKTEDLLMQSRQESLELTETKATLERELNLVRLQLEGSDQSRASDITSAKTQLNKELTKTIQEKELTHQMAVSKLEDMIRRQSHIIGELKHQCTLVTDKLEDSVKSFTRDKNAFNSSNQKLGAENERLRSEVHELAAGLEERGRAHHALCRRLDACDQERIRLADELKGSALRAETAIQERKVLEHETSFLKELLRAKGFLPKDFDDSSKPEIGRGHPVSFSAMSRSNEMESVMARKKRKERRKSGGKRERSQDKNVLNQAILVERNGEISSPLIKK